ncbi:MAG: MarR family transcriptional regulator [Candidatus Krumholzibacteriota bacterium]
MKKIDRELSENIRIMALVIADICHRSTLQKASSVHLTRNQFTILKVLSTQGDFQISDLARLLDISNAAISKNIDRLEQLGLVARQTKPDDRRSLDLVLLNEGYVILDEYDRILGDKQKHLMEQFSGREKKALLDMVKKVITFTLAEEQDTEVICLQCGGNCGDSCVIETCQGLCTLPARKKASR